MHTSMRQPRLFHFCPGCGEHERVELLEVWEDGSFQLDACCEFQLEHANEFLAEDPEGAAEWLEGLRDADGDTFSELMGMPLRRVLDDDCGGLVLDYKPFMRPVAWRIARAFIGKFHRHCKPPAGWRFGAAIFNGFRMIGAVTVGRPVARSLDHRTVVEVNRLCVRDDLVPGLAWNACSMAYGWAAREAKRRGFGRIVTYTLASEAGTSLRAAGWSHDGTVRGRSWSCTSRPRGDNTPTEDKLRWARELTPARRRPLQPISLAA